MLDYTWTFVTFLITSTVRLLSSRFLLATAFIVTSLASSAAISSADDAALASIEVRCTADYALSQVTLRAKPVRDPYVTESSDALDRFRVALQYLASAEKIKTWVYQTIEGKQILVHAAEYRFDASSCRGRQDFGVHRVYSSPMERELLLQCAAFCP